jgi:predicted CXXCH cytochrome family protein
MRILSLVILFVALYLSNQKTESPHGSSLKVSCKTCHSAKGWTLDKEIYSFNHNKTKLPLEGQHSQITCRQCHTTLVFNEAKSECFQCHKDLHQGSTGTDCSRCHTPASWLVNNVNVIHERSRVPLLGAHRMAECDQCHKSESLLRFDVLGVNCVDCHRNNYMATTNPNHVKSGISEDCSQCHPLSAFQWSGAGFNHNVFPLVQGHSLVKCIDCHKTKSFTDARQECYLCHQQDYLATKNPNHSISKISTVCQDCHSLSPGWKPSKFDHTLFPLKLGHSTPVCSDCHINGNYISTSADCYSCHQKNYQATLNPNHVTNGFAKTCQNCHTVNVAWKPASLDHSKFPLTLGHSAINCVDCHIGGNYTSTATACYSCHQKNYTATTNPNHIGAGFSTVCSTCHSTAPGWKSSTFKHIATFPLTLGHAGRVCTDCHKGGNYSSTSKDCSSCHQQDYNATTNPNHLTAGFPATCTTCHTSTAAWKPATFSHSTFPLTLGHAAKACIDCHKTGNYTAISKDCYTCHQQTYTATTNPNHVTSGFSTACATCHTTNPAWKPATFNHIATFPLTLGHAGRTCVECHKSGTYTSTPKDCYSCHQLDYTASTNPNHITAGMPTVCTTCHTTSPGWKPATFSHTSFPLTLGHAGRTCLDCHKGGNYTSTPKDCYSCHQQAYTATTNPNHITAGIPTTCTTCHTTSPGWKPATFSHTTFPLTLGHATPTCNDCHKGNYTTTSKDCYTCHVTDYNNSTNPNHKTLAFATVCTQCHTANPGWKPASYTQHDSQFFPIYSGRHLGKWTVCTDCHTNTANYALFVCKSCHSSVHRSNNYTDAQCYSCHPRGSTN